MGEYSIHQRTPPYRRRSDFVLLPLAAVKVLFGCLGILLFLVVGKLLAGCLLCIPSGKPAIDPASLLIDASDLPPGWTVCERGKFKNPGLTEGAEEVAFVSFCSAEPQARSGEDIYRYCGEGKATWEWEHNAYIGEYLGGTEDWWQIPEAVEQIDIRADQWRVGCTDRWFRDEMFCSFHARYGEYIVDFSATVAVKGQEVITMSELASILEEIDRRMVERNALVAPR